MVHSNNLIPMCSPRQFKTPSHILYANDILLFCKATKRKLENMMSLFHSCDLAFEQFINPKKCFFFPGSIPPHKMVEIKDQLGFKFGCLPFIYLGIPIFLGKPKNIHLKPIFDKVKWKLLSWK